MDEVNVVRPILRTPGSYAFARSRVLFCLSCSCNRHTSSDC